MTEPHIARPNHWMPAIISSLVVGLVIAGGAVVLKDQLLTQFETDSAKQTDERKKLATRIDAIQNGVETISSQPKADTDAISSQFTEVNGKLIALTERVTALEQKPEPAPAAAPAPVASAAPIAAPAPSGDSAALKLAVTSGKPFATELAAWHKLHPQADAKTLAPLLAAEQSGITSEAELNSRLRLALDAATESKKIDDVSMIGKINTHLSGLVSIKKAADTGPYTKLRADVTRDDIETLTASVEKLSDADRKPLEDWLASAHARRDALASLTKLDTAGAE